MDLLDTILKSANGDVVGQMAARLGSSQTDTQAALSQVLGVLGKGVARNAAATGGLEALASALGKGGHSKYLDDPSALAAPAATADGNGILGHILGSKDASRAVAARVAGKAGVSEDLVKKLLPLAAAAMMGALAKQTNGGTGLAQAAPGRAAAGSPLGGLLGMLDADGDGSAADDLLGMAGRFLR